MKWMIAAILIAVLGLPIAFTAGVVISLDVAADKNPAKSLKDLMGSAGDWVSGLGALAAAVVAVYLANRQRQDELPNLSVSAHGSYSFSIVNYGRLPIEVNAQWLYLTSKYGTFVLGLDMDHEGKERAVLGFGESTTFCYHDILMLNIASWAHVECHRDIDAISLVVSTPLKAFKFPLPDYIKSRLRNELNKIKQR
ncbi:hypothetical protein ACW9IO_18025 [Pseudomonas azotoformans]